LGELSEIQDERAVDRVRIGAPHAIEGGRAASAVIVEIEIHVDLIGGAFREQIAVGDAQRISVHRKRFVRDQHTVGLDHPDVKGAAELQGFGFDFQIEGCLLPARGEDEQGRDEDQVAKETCVCNGQAARL
jgi:hypothetical protein